jgi:uncharacterized protein (DUF302 family)
MADYGRRIVVDSPFEALLGKASRAIRDEGMQIIARVDVRDHLWRDLGHNFGCYFLMTAWSPELALAALGSNPDMGAFLPATFAIYELAEGQTAVVVNEPLWPMTIEAEWRKAHPELTAIADRENERIARVLDRLRAPFRHASVQPAA